MGYSWFWTSLILACSTSLVPECLAGELKFCYNGPQRILYQDCPGGFILREPIETSCLYYRKADDVPNMAALFSDDICDEKKTKELDPDFQEIPENGYQLIQFVDVDIAGGPTPGADPGLALDKCNASCLSDWVDPIKVDSTPIFIDKEPNPDNEADQKTYIETTRIILIRIINEESDIIDDQPIRHSPAVESHPFLKDVEATNEESVLEELPPSARRMAFLIDDSIVLQGSMISVMRLLAKSMKVLYRKCMPFVEPAFYALVFRTMEELRRLNEDFPDVNTVPVNRIIGILDKCEKETNIDFVLNGTECEDKSVVQTITFPKQNRTIVYKPQPNSFRWGRYDPIIEAAWSSVTFVHAHCFNHFVEDILHYSFFVSAMHEFFLMSVVTKHWLNPSPVGKGMTLWEMAFETPDVQNQLQNLDACVIAAYTDSFFERRLERPFTTEKQMHEPKFENPEPAAKGWPKGVDDYWKMYGKRGFQGMVNNLGYCIQTPEEYLEIEKQVKDEFCNKIPGV